MRLIIDTNIILSALIKQSTTRSILTNPQFEFYIADFSIQEIQKYKNLVIEKSGLTNEKIELLFAIIMENIKIINKTQLKPKLKEAFKIMENIDPKDSPILACALTIPNEGIWTEDKHFKKQNKIKVYNKKELLAELK
jgi:predicted nucleic acid-binding protein